MATTDGTITHYAIYRANLHYNLARREPYIDLNRGAQRIATVTRDKRQEDCSWQNDELTQRYLEMAQPFATPHAPAFAFTNCVFCYGTDPECRCARRSNTPKTESGSSLAAEQAQTGLYPND
jgi:hypothetical protein